MRVGVRGDNMFTFFHIIPLHPHAHPHPYVYVFHIISPHPHLLALMRVGFGGDNMKNINIRVGVGGDNMKKRKDIISPHPTFITYYLPQFSWGWGEII
jgi:hypothetical protein